MQEEKGEGRRERGLQERKGWVGEGGREGYVRVE